MLSPYLRRYVIKDIKNALTECIEDVPSKKILKST